jgi:hypothetical protein
VSDDNKQNTKLPNVCTGFGTRFTTNHYWMALALWTSQGRQLDQNFLNDRYHLKMN